MSAPSPKVTDLLRVWESGGRSIRCLYARAGGRSAAAIDGRVRLAGADRLLIHNREPSMTLSIRGAHAHDGRLRYLPPPFNAVKSVEALQLSLETKDWVVLSPDESIEFRPSLAAQ